MADYENAAAGMQYDGSHDCGIFLVFRKGRIYGRASEGVRRGTQIECVLGIVINAHVLADIIFRIFDIVPVVFRVVNLSSLSSDCTLCACGPLSSKFA